MNAFALALKTLVDTLGATVLLPVFIFIFAIILGRQTRTRIPIRIDYRCCFYRN